MALVMSIPRGVPITVDSAVSAPATGNVFTFQPRPDGGNLSALFLAQGTLTTLAAKLQLSMDGGTTWQDYISSVNFWPAPSTNLVSVSVVAGAVYRINYTTASGSINAIVSTN